MPIFQSAIMEKSEVTAMELVEVKNEKDLAVLMPLLREIWSEVFTPIIGAEQVAYMLANYQSQANIEDEMKNGAHYHLHFNDTKTK